MAKHTPGPWEVGENGSYVNVATNSFIHPHEPRLPTPTELEELGDECHDDWRICNCEGSMFDRSPAECAANATLIAAAPDMLEALDTLIAVVGLTALKYEGQRAVLQEAVDAAIAAKNKATGNLAQTTK